MSTKETYVILRGYKSGVHAGYIDLNAIDGQWLTLSRARRIWRWSGAAELNTLAVYGPMPEKIQECKFGPEVDTHLVDRSDVSEIIVCQTAGELAIQSIPRWTT